MVSANRIRGIKKPGWYLGGMRVTVDPLLPLVIIFLAWILSERYFPEIMYTQATWIYRVMGIVSSFFLTLSIFFHEYGHALAARWLKLPLERIHLYLFGGMAELKQRPVRPLDEMIIALAGPLASLIFAFVAWGLAAMTHPVHNSTYLVIEFVFYMNLLLAGFNLLPIFPLDGGRTLRAVLWWIKGYYYKASVITFYISMIIIILFMVLSLALLVTEGVTMAFWGALFSGYLWYTAYRGRDELVYRPKFEDLIFPINQEESPAAIIRQIHRMDSRSLPNTVIPVTKDGELESVILGKDLKRVPEEDDAIGYLYRPVEKGFFVDLEDESTYRYGVTLKAQFLPVLKDGNILGMSDGHEIRFWLLQQKNTLFLSEYLVNKDE